MVLPAIAAIVIVSGCTSNSPRPGYENGTFMQQNRTFSIQEAVSACNGMNAGDNCSYAVNGSTVEGTCITLRDGMHPAGYGQLHRKAGDERYRTLSWRAECTQYWVIHANCSATNELILITNTISCYGKEE